MQVAGCSCGIQARARAVPRQQHATLACTAPFYHAHKPATHTHLPLHACRATRRTASWRRTCTTPAWSAMLPRASGPRWRPSASCRWTLSARAARCAPQGGPPAGLAVCGGGGLLPIHSVPTQSLLVGSPAKLSSPPPPLPLQGHFPEPDKDPVIQIASLVTEFGQKAPTVRNIMTLKSCAPITGAGEQKRGLGWLGQSKSGAAQPWLGLSPACCIPALHLSSPSPPPPLPLPLPLPRGDVV